MESIEPLAGSHIYNVLTEAVEKAPCLFKFNGMKFETRVGETLEEASIRFEDEHGFTVTTPQQDADKAKADMEESENKWAKDIAEAGVATEQQMRKIEAPWPTTPEELTTYISTLVDRPHDYGTCVYAMSLAAVAAYHYVAKKLGCTGFQAGCADMDILRQTRNFNWGKLLDYEDLVYPQYCNEERFPSLDTLFSDPKVVEHLATLAKEKLANESGAHPDVAEHWNKLANNINPRSN